MARAPPSSGGGSGGAANGRGAGGLQPLQQKLQQHIDREDRRIKELTEAILYDFLPRALRAVAGGGGDYARELTPKKCRVRQLGGHGCWPAGRGVLLSRTGPRWCDKRTGIETDLAQLLPMQCIGKGMAPRSHIRCRLLRGRRWQWRPS